MKFMFESQQNEYSHVIQNFNIKKRYFNIFVQEKKIKLVLGI